MNSCSFKLVAITNFRITGSRSYTCTIPILFLSSSSLSPTHAGDASSTKSIYDLSRAFRVAQPRCFSTVEFLIVVDRKVLVDRGQDKSDLSRNWILKYIHTRTQIRWNARAYLNYHLLLNYTLRDRRRDFRCIFHSVVTLIDHWSRSFHPRHTSMIFYGIQAVREYFSLRSSRSACAKFSSLWKREHVRYLLWKNAERYFQLLFVDPICMI